MSNTKLFCDTMENIYSFSSLQNDPDNFMMLVNQDSSELKKESETIHSGHFMVSHFEAEAQDDEDKDIPSMPDPDESNTCTDLQLSQTSHSNRMPLANTIIDISLTKLFKCMNLAYRQKLTSPKWNRFKGVRLRWKDKIRLNNLIWRCWHIQFIMKMKTLVCQFASPLDVDIHSKPETVVLEGKYWKRQFDVIKAEYMKWRKFYRTKGTQFVVDTSSELDMLDWSPTNSEKILLGGTEEYYDTLFSTINAPFPFPDSREIAKAGIADFIQPSLGPLQPNLDDFMNGISFPELLNSQRLPPVPEEVTEDMFKSVEFGFPALMESTNICELDNTINTKSVPYSNDKTFTQNDINMQEQSQIIQVQHHQQQNTQVNVVPMDTFTCDQDLLLDNNKQLISNTSMESRNFDNQSVEKIIKPNMRPYTRREPHNYDKIQPTQHQTIVYNQILVQHQEQQLQQLQQQQQHQQLQHNQQQSLNTLGKSASNSNVNVSNVLVYNNKENSSSQLYLPNNSSIRFMTNNFLNKINNELTLTNNHTAISPQVINQSSTSNLTYSQPPSVLNRTSTVGISMNPPQLQKSQSTPSNTLALLLSHSTLSATSSTPCTTTATLSLSSSTIGIGNIQESYKAATNHQQNSSYKPYPSQQPYKHVNQSIGYNHITPRNPSQPSSPNQQYIGLPSTSTNLSDQQSAKEMYRSNSLPINASLPLQEEMFIVPMYQAKPNRLRTRSNSLIAKQLNQSLNNNNMKTHPQIQSASSEPMLSTLEKLLNTNSSTISSQYNCPTNSIGVPQQQIAVQQLSHPQHLQKEPQQQQQEHKQHHEYQEQQKLIQQQILHDSQQTLQQRLQFEQQREHQQLKTEQEQRQHSLQSQTQLLHSQQYQSPVYHQQKQVVQQQQSIQYQHETQSTTNINQLRAQTDSVGLSLHRQLIKSNAPSTAQRNGNVVTFVTSKSTSPPPCNSPELISDMDSPLSPSRSNIVCGGNSSSSSSGALCSSGGICGPNCNGGLTCNNCSSSSSSNMKCPRDTNRRVGHIHAEQKRRYNIKNGFDVLHTLIPQLQQNPNAKLSKAAMLQKSVEYIKQLRSERASVKEKMEALIKERDSLNNSLNHLHSVLPANGASSIARQRTGRVRQLYNDYVHERTLENWKFWILGLIFEPLLNSFNVSVSMASMDELYRTAMLWVDQHCSLIEMRPAVSNKLRYLSTSTDILSDPPTTLRDEVIKAMSSNK